MTSSGSRDVRRASEAGHAGGFLASAVGWVLFLIGVRRARTIGTLPLIVLLVIGVAWCVSPPGWALGVTGAAMTAAFAWLGRRVIDGPVSPEVTRASR